MTITFSHKTASCLAALATIARAEPPPVDAAALRAFFAGCEVRPPGSTGNLAAEAKVAGRFRAAAEGDDGVVEYKSAHIEGVESELVVRSHHSVQGHPDAIEEVRRILLLHAGID